MPARCRLTCNPKKPPISQNVLHFSLVVHPPQARCDRQWGCRIAHPNRLTPLCGILRAKIIAGTRQALSHL
jgi:hypothetical protein